MRVRFWGTRGSIATPGPSTLRFGGNTSCVEVVTNSGQRFIFDCGTGIRPLGLHLLATVPKPIEATILLGHTHWDHIQGFPFFAPVFVPGNRFTICAPTGVGGSLAHVLAGQMEFTYFPVELGQLPSAIEYLDLSEGTYDFNGVRIVTQFLNHPAVALGYRIEADGVVVAYMCDHEPFSAAIWKEGAVPGHLESILHDGDRRHALFMKHADLLIHDAQYTPEEYPAKKNWGHSTYQTVVELASTCDVRQVALTHHDPLHDDAAVADIERRAQILARQLNFSMHVFCAYEGYETELEPPRAERDRTVKVALASGVMPAQVRVLIVDDDPNLRALASAALLREGYVVLEASGGLEGLSRVEAYRPNLVLLDINMPDLDGISVLKQLRAQDNNRTLPVIILTAASDETATHAGFEAGATDYLTKPFTLPQLTARVRACLARNN